MSLLVGDFDRMETTYNLVVLNCLKTSLLVGDFDRMETALPALPSFLSSLGSLLVGDFDRMETVFQAS